tara:strand:+ start:261 stop:605 length:345 start_codon:yes stop_codon:yes gene_type:complete
MSIRKTTQFLESMGEKIIREAHKEMLDNPAFQLIAGAIADLRIPSLIQDPSGEKALQQNGFVCGVAGALELLLHAEEYAVEKEEERNESMERYLVDVAGYSAEEARAMIAAEEK